MHFACANCGHLGESEGDCPSCHQADLLDIRRPEVVELLRDTDSRIAQNRNDKIRWLSVGLGIFVGVAINFIPGFRWPIVLPFGGHWWIFTIACSLGIMHLLEKTIGAKSRFPYIDAEPVLEQADSSL